MIQLENFKWSYLRNYFGQLAQTLFKVTGMKFSLPHTYPSVMFPSLLRTTNKTSCL